MSKNIADKIKGHAERGNMAGVASEAYRAAAQIETFRKALAARDARIAELEAAVEVAGRGGMRRALDAAIAIAAHYDNASGDPETMRRKSDAVLEVVEAIRLAIGAPWEHEYEAEIAAQAARAERAKCDEEYRGRIDEARDTVLNCRHALAEGPLEGDPDTVNDILDIIDNIYPPAAAYHLEANGRYQA